MSLHANSRTQRMLRARSDNVARWRAHQDMSTLPDPFAEQPIRRSAILVSVCALIVFGPWLISEQFGTTVMLSIGWLAITGMVIGSPILVICLIEEAILRTRRRFHPTIDELDLSPRVAHILVRHGYETVEAVQAAPDSALLMLSNMDERGLREVRRAIALWTYARWQEAGFPARDSDLGRG